MPRPKKAKLPLKTKLPLGYKTLREISDQTGIDDNTLRMRIIREIKKLGAKDSLKLKTEEVPYIMALDNRNWAVREDIAREWIREKVNLKRVKSGELVYYGDIAASRGIKLGTLASWFDRPLFRDRPDLVVKLKGKRYLTKKGTKIIDKIVMFRRKAIPMKEANRILGKRQRSVLERRWVPLGLVKTIEEPFKGKFFTKNVSYVDREQIKKIADFERTHCTSEEAGRRIGVSPPILRWWIKTGKLPTVEHPLGSNAYKTRNLYFVSDSVVEELTAAKREKPDGKMGEWLAIIERRRKERLERERKKRKQVTNYLKSIDGDNLFSALDVLRARARTPAMKTFFKEFAYRLAQAAREERLTLQTLQETINVVNETLRSKDLYYGRRTLGEIEKKHFLKK